MSFPTKSERTRCYTDRDTYWACLDKYGTAAAEGEIPSQCKTLRKAFETACPGQWVKHFDRKRLYELFQAKIAKGIDPLEERK